MTTAEHLERIIERLSNRDRWTTGNFADTGPEHTHAVNPNSPNAQRWCLHGAVYAEFPRIELDTASDAGRHQYFIEFHNVMAALYRCTEIGLWRVNDELGYDAVRALLAKALNHARTQETQ